MIVNPFAAAQITTQQTLINETSHMDHIQQQEIGHQNEKLYFNELHLQLPTFQHITAEDAHLVPKPQNPDQLYYCNDVIKIMKWLVKTNIGAMSYRLVQIVLGFCKCLARAISVLLILLILSLQGSTRLLPFMLVNFVHFKFQIVTCLLFRD